MIRASRFVADGVHVYSEWLNDHEEMRGLLCRGEVDRAIVGEAVSRVKVRVAQRFRVALANVQTSMGRL